MLSINTNLPSLIAQSSLRTSTNKLNTAIERMTTGLKINSAKDNAANYSITTNISGKLSSYDVAEENTAMGLDLVSTASESLDLISDKLARLRVLAEQAANGTYGSQSLQAINSEANALVDEIERIYSTSQYNGIELFQKEENAFITEVNRRDTSSMTKLSSVDPEQTLARGEYSISTAEELIQLSEMSKNGKIPNYFYEFVLANDIDLSAYSEGEGWKPITEFSGTFDGNGYIISNLYINKPNGEGGLFGISNHLLIRNLGLENIDITIDKGGPFAISLRDDETVLDNCYTTGTLTSNANGYYFHGTIHGAGLEIKDCYSKLTDHNGTSLTRQETYATMITNVTNYGTSDFSPETTLQIGINDSTDSQLTLGLKLELFGLGYLRSIGSNNCSSHLGTIDKLISDINAKQTEYGATQNRLESALEEISTQYENLVSSRSTLRDADITEVSSEYIKQQILQQASATLLATANQTPSLALQLL